MNASFQCSPNNVTPTTITVMICARKPPVSWLMNPFICSVSLATRVMSCPTLYRS